MSEESSVTRRAKSPSREKFLAVAIVFFGSKLKAQGHGPR